MRVAIGADHHGRTMDFGQAQFHLVAIDDAMSFRGQGAGLNRIDQITLEQLGAARRIVGLAPPPELDEMGAVGIRCHLVDDFGIVVRVAPRHVDHRHRG